MKFLAGCIREMERKGLELEFDATSDLDFEAPIVHDLQLGLISEKNVLIYSHMVGLKIPYYYRLVTHNKCRTCFLNE
jgi:hypothetical protein